MTISKKLLWGMLLFLMLPVFLGLAQNNSLPTPKTTDPALEREALQKELEKLEKLIAEYEKDIQKTEQEKKTLQNQISLLKSKISQLELQIQQGNIMIRDLSYQIGDTKASIEKTSLKIEDLKQKLANILRTIDEENQKSLIEILLSEETLSGFFDNLMALEILNSKIKEFLKNIKNLKSYLENQRQSLSTEKRNLEKVVQIQYSQKQQSEAVKQEQERLLKMTKAQYQQYLKEKREVEERAAEIRARIFELIGVREAPSYEKAVEIAKYISGITGIRPAFLLGILTQESRIGKYVGQCYLKDPQTGMGVKFKTGQKWPRVMKPSWVPLYLKIIEELNQQKKLNLDPFATPISCWIAACVNKNYRVTYNVSVDSEGRITCPSGYSPFGWGGAMGPAQLMPFNWIGSDNYKYRIEEITGRVANPWDFSDALLGAALHLKDCRADLSERKAAACYFGGWGNRNNPYHLRNYADPVMALSQCHQDFIDKGTMSSWCEKRIF
jgi:peptidoglycan hydrolase CwlO-like protein